MTIAIYWVVSEERRKWYLDYKCRHTGKCLVKVYGTRYRRKGEIRGGSDGLGAESGR